eukprot:3347379-Rhodomonas_salina.1
MRREAHRDSKLNEARGRQRFMSEHQHAVAEGSTHREVFRLSPVVGRGQKREGVGSGADDGAVSASGALMEVEQVMQRPQWALGALVCHAHLLQEDTRHRQTVVPLVYGLLQVDQVPGRRVLRKLQIEDLRSREALQQLGLAEPSLHLPEQQVQGQGLRCPVVA